jgi:poly-gamma-glutamate synthesis protein (capsule biosynthesis protein)
VRELVSEGYLPIVTFQHEEFYRWEPVEEMISDFQRMAEAGAVIVSGSQAHQPHRMEFFGNSMLRYGLGNLFFDQKGWYPDSDKAFIDRHVFYDGKYLGVELLTVQFFDYSQPVWMTPEARASLLNQLFSSSGWEQ